MLTWAGQVALHGAVDRLEIPYPPGIACSYCLKIAFRGARPWLCSLGISTGQTAVHSPHDVHFNKSTNLGFSFTRAIKFPSSPSSSSRSVFVNNSIFRCRPTSTSLGEITHMVQSLVGNVLSSCAIIPPMANDFSTRYT